MGLFNNKPEQLTKQPKKRPRSREDLIHFTSINGDTDTSVKGEFAIDSKALDTTENFIRQLQNIEDLPSNITDDLNKLGGRINNDNNDINKQHNNAINILKKVTTTDNGNTYWDVYNGNMLFEKNNLNNTMQKRDGALEDEKNIVKDYLDKIRQNVTSESKKNIDYIKDRADKRFSNIKAEFKNEKQRLHGNSATEGNLRTRIMGYGDSVNDLKPDAIKNKELHDINSVIEDNPDKKKALKLKNTTKSNNSIVKQNNTARLNNSTAKLNNDVSYINSNMIDAMRMPGH